MAAPSGYDIGLQHASVNSGVAVGFLLDENQAGEAFVEEQVVVADLDVTTGGAVSVAHYGLGV